MSKHLERDLESLDQEILDQSSRVEEMIAKSCQALIEQRRSDNGQPCKTATHHGNPSGLAAILPIAQ